MMVLIFIGQFHFINMIPNNQFFFNNKNSFPSPVQFGVIQSNDFDSGNYTKVVNGGTVFNDTYNPSNIVLNIGTSDGSLLNYIRYDDWITSRNNFKLTQTFTVDTNGAQSEGTGFILRPQVGDISKTIEYAIITGNTANKGKHVWVINNTFGFYSSGTPINVSIGDVLTTSLEKDGLDYIMTTTNNTQGGTVTDTYTYSLAYPQSIIIPTYIKFGICCHGGQQTITNIEIYSNEYYNCDALFIGDSKTVGYYSGGISNNFISIIKTLYPSKYIYLDSGAGGKSEDALLIIDDILSYNPRKAFMFIGCNDVRTGSSYQTYYPQVVSALEAIGVTVYHVLSAPENSINVTGLNSWITTNYPANRIIDVYTPLKDGGTGLNALYDSGDGIHPNSAGNTLIASTITSQIVF